MNQSTHRRFAASFLALAAALLGACFDAAPSEEVGVLAINLRTGDTRRFDVADPVPPGWQVCPDDRCPAPAACGELDEAACLARADCAPIYAEGRPDQADPFVGCVEGGAGLCEPADCGPQPGIPAIECEDGSLGGFTGRCVATPEGGCAWEILECPEVCDCGPAPGANPRCDDGSDAILECLTRADATCGWAFSCPEPDECGADECGPALGMPSWECADGSIGGATGRCLRNDDGTCGWEVRECPGVDECAEADCGPAPGAHPRCPDGSESETVCAPAIDGACGWQFLCGGAPL